MPAWLAHPLARHLPPFDLMSFKCPLVAVALPGGHVPVVQLEEKSTLHAHVKHNLKAHVWKMAGAHWQPPAPPFLALLHKSSIQ